MYLYISPLEEINTEMQKAKNQQRKIDVEHKTLLPTSEIYNLGKKIYSPERPL